MALQQGDNNQDVASAQTLLIAHGYTKVSNDGDFGPITLAAVNAFQTANGIQTTGVIDDATLQALNLPVGPDILGVDVSFYQQNINWAQVKSSGITFAYVKASEGSRRIEPMANGQATGAKAQGIAIGYYHFSNLNDPNVVGDADIEAQLFAQCLSNLPSSDLIPVLDIETNKSNLSPALVQQWITEFINKMASFGYQRIMIYSYAPFLDQWIPEPNAFAEFYLWLASYTNAPFPKLPVGWPALNVWQYSNVGKVPGIGTCDVNKCKILPTI